MSGVCHTHLKQPLAASCQFAPAPQHQLAQLPVSPGVPAFLLRQGRGVWVNIQQPFKPNGPNQKQKLNKSHGIHGTICIFYLHENHKNELNVGKYTSPMDPMGMHGLIQGPFLVDWCDHQKSVCIFSKQKCSPKTSGCYLKKSSGPKPWINFLEVPEAFPTSLIASSSSSLSLRSRFLCVCVCFFCLKSFLFRKWDTVDWCCTLELSP